MSDNTLKGLPKFPTNPTPLQIGLYYEEYTKARLLKDGFGFMAHSYKAHPHEIDLVMTEGSDIVFVEVKARLSSSASKPELAVDKKKMMNIFYAAAHFIGEMMERGIDAKAFSYRFDLAAIEHSADGKIEDFRYHKSYYAVDEKPLLQYAKRYRENNLAP